MSASFQLKTICVLWISISSFVLAQNQNILLSDYSQKDSTTTCESGLLHNIDYFGFKCVVKLEKNVTVSPFITFEIKKNFTGSRYIGLLTINVKTQCGNTEREDNMEYTCTNKMEDEYHITILYKALLDNSGASIRAFHTIDKGYSNTIQHLPVHQPTDVNGQLIINKENMSTEFCSATIVVTKLNLEFYCNSSAKPCQIEIQMDGITELKGKYVASLERSIIQGEELNLTIKYAACRLDDKYRTFNCRINTSYSEMYNPTADLMPLFVSAVGFFVVAFIICYAFNKRQLIYAWIARNRQPEANTGIETHYLKETYLESAAVNTPFIKDYQKGDENIVSKDNIYTHTPECSIPLIKLVDLGDNEAVSMEIKNGADVNATTSDERTALMKASEKGYESIVQLLIESGAEVNKKTHDGKTALQLATQNGHVKIAELLRKYGAAVY